MGKLVVRTGASGSKGAGDRVRVANGLELLRLLWLSILAGCDNNLQCFLLFMCF